jgi:hypothetical protein
MWPVQFLAKFPVEKLFTILRRFLLWPEYEELDLLEYQGEGGFSVYATLIS